MSEATKPHEFCPHIKAFRPVPCSARCRMSEVESDAHYANRRELAEEGDGYLPERKCSCRMDGWQEEMDALAEQALVAGCARRTACPDGQGCRRPRWSLCPKGHPWGPFSKTTEVA